MVLKTISKWGEFWQNHWRKVTWLLFHSRARLTSCCIWKLIFCSLDPVADSIPVSWQSVLPLEDIISSGKCSFLFPEDILVLSTCFTSICMAAKDLGSVVYGVALCCQNRCQLLEWKWKVHAFSFSWCGMRFKYDLCLTSNIEEAFLVLVAEHVLIIEWQWWAVLS